MPIQFITRKIGLVFFSSCLFFYGCLLLVFRLIFVCYYFFGGLFYFFFRSFVSVPLVLTDAIAVTQVVYSLEGEQC